MKAWLLRPMNDEAGPWSEFFDRIFGFVVRAENESHARSLAAEQAGDEGPDAWLCPHHSVCVDISGDGPAGVILFDSNPPK